MREDASVPARDAGSVLQTKISIQEQRAKVNCVAFLATTIALVAIAMPKLPNELLP
jgi:hypothetical protein